MGADEVRVRMISALELQEESVFSRQRTSRQTETEPETEVGKKKVACKRASLCEKNTFFLLEFFVFVRPRAREEEEEKPRSSGLKLKSTHNAQRTAWVSSLLEVQCHQALPAAEERKAVSLHLGVRCIRIDIGTRSDREREQVCVRIACGAFVRRFVRMCRGGLKLEPKKTCTAAHAPWTDGARHS